MAVNKMPKGWLLESGTIGTDVDFDTTVFNTGGRSIKLLPTSGNTVVLSQPIAVGEDSSDRDTVRRKVGLTVSYYHGAFGAAPGMTVGFRFYDKDGIYLSSVNTTCLNELNGMEWETTGLVADVPNNAQFARAYADYSNATDTTYLDYMLPYAMPPFAEADVTEHPLTPIAGLGTWYALASTINSGSGTAGSHAIVNDRSAGDYQRVQETGVYHIELHVTLDVFAATDAFAIAISTTTRRTPSTIFSPALGSAALSLPGGAHHMQMATVVPLKAGDAIKAEIAQLAGGVFREVTSGLMVISKET